jgi:hypothetical protein
MVWVKIVVVILLLAILASLLAGGSFLIKDDSTGRRMLTSLKLRVALSITLAAFLLLSYRMGWLQPHSAYRVSAPADTVSS